MTTKISLLVFIGIALIIPLAQSTLAQSDTGVLLLSINGVDANFNIVGPKTLTKSNATSFDPNIKVGFGPRYGWRFEGLPAGEYEIIPEKVTGYFVPHVNDGERITFTTPGFGAFQPM